MFRHLLIFLTITLDAHHDKNIILRMRTMLKRMLIEKKIKKFLAAEGSCVGRSYLLEFSLVTWPLDQVAGYWPLQAEALPRECDLQLPRGNAPSPIPLN